MESKQNALRKLQLKWQWDSRNEIYWFSMKMIENRIEPLAENQWQINAIQNRQVQSCTPYRIQLKYLTLPYSKYTRQIDAEVSFDANKNGTLKSCKISPNHAIPVRPTYGQRHQLLRTALQWGSIWQCAIQQLLLPSTGHGYIHCTALLVDMILGSTGRLVVVYDMI